MPRAIPTKTPFLPKNASDPREGEDWLLITSAFHMPRSMGIFRALGMDLDAYPVDYRTLGDAEDFRPPADGPQAIRNVELARANGSV